jgi:hypothetical protein
MSLVGGSVSRACRCSGAFLKIIKTGADRKCLLAFIDVHVPLSNGREIFCAPSDDFSDAQCPFQCPLRSHPYFRREALKGSLLCHCVCSQAHVWYAQMGGVFIDCNDRVSVKHLKFFICRRH